MTNEKIAYLVELRHLMESETLTNSAKAEFLRRINDVCNDIEDGLGIGNETE